MLHNNAIHFGVYFFADILEWINDHISPEEVFDLEKLKEWAKENGWTEPEEKESQDAS